MLKQLKTRGVVLSHKNADSDESERTSASSVPVQEPSVVPAVQTITTPTDGSIHAQIQGVINGNNRTEFLLMGGTTVLFLLGAIAVVTALISGQYIWTIPSAGISAFLYWPYLRIEKLRNRNIALAASAALISRLPPAEAAKEIQKLLEKLFREDT